MKDKLLESLMATVRRAERFLGPEDDWVEDDRRVLYEAAQRAVGDSYRYFTFEKGERDYVTTVEADPDVVERVLMPPYQRNLVSSRKYRTHHSGGKQWACGSFVIDAPHTAWQHHVYLFEAPNGATDVYAHRETSVREGKEHLTDTNQTPGDPHELFNIFDRAELEYGERSL
jgi:hypothetical protein